MKKLLVLAILFGFLGSMEAQENRVKLGLFGLTYKNVNLKYERILGARTSVGATIGFRPKGSLNRASSADIQEVTIDLKHKVFTVLPEFRYYFSSKENHRGLYTGVNLDYLNIGFEGETMDDGYNYDGSINLNSFGAGINLGAQWLIADRFCIDWHIFGIGFGRAKLDLNYATDDPAFSASEAIAEINEVIGDVPGVDEITDYLSDNTSLSASTPGFFIPRFRTGLSIGYAF